VGIDRPGRGLETAFWRLPQHEERWCDSKCGPLVQFTTHPNGRSPERVSKDAGVSAESPSEDPWDGQKLAKSNIMLVTMVVDDRKPMHARPSLGGVVRSDVSWCMQKLPT
jgi:hypothetical protein